MADDDEPYPLGGGTRADPQPWQPETNPLRLAVLGKLIEELCECGGIAARCIIQGIDEIEPVTGKPNFDALQDEVADVMAQIEHTMNRLKLTATPRMKARMQDRMLHKVQFTGRWMDGLTPPDA